MLPPLQIKRVSPADLSIEELRDEASRQGFAFLDRLIREWASGENQFNGFGEQLLGAFFGERLVGVGGLNREPYDPAPRQGRLRHLYVLQAYRKQGVGRHLVRHLLEDADAAVDEVRLRTDGLAAARFYQRLGFEPVLLATATHSKDLGKRATDPRRSDPARA